MLDIEKFKTNVSNFNLGDKGFQQWQLNTLLNSLTGSVKVEDIQNVPADIMLQVFYGASEHFNYLTASDVMMANLGERILNAPRAISRRKLL
jgi:hypothetical protein